MFNRVRKQIALVIAGFMVVGLAFAPASVAAATISPEIEGGLKCGSSIKNALSGCDSSTSIGSTGLTDLIIKLINIFSWVVGIVAVLMIIYGGFRYITSAGESGAINSAKTTIIYAIVGLIVVALAQFIVQFVIDRITSV